MVVAIYGTILSFDIRDLPVRLQSMDRYWMWYSGFDLAISNPLRAILGWGTISLPVNIPRQLEYLWLDLQQVAWNLSGIYPYNFHSFWLRFTFSWGLLFSLPLLVFLLRIIISPHKPKIIRALSLLFIVEGLTMGVVYLSNVAIPLLLAMLPSFNILIRKKKNV